MKSRSTKFRFPVFGNYTVYVELTSDIRESMTKRPATKAAISEDMDIVGGICVHALEEGQTWVFLPLKVKAGVVAHECWHVIKAIMNHFNSELDNEMVAYHLGYLVQKVSDFIRKRK